MGICWTKFWVLYFLVLLHLVYLTSAQIRDFPTANLSTSWINSPYFNDSLNFGDASIVSPILLRSSIGPQFVCGFFCNETCNSYLFAILIFPSFSLEFFHSNPTSYFLNCTPQVVWSANRNNPVGINATLQLTSDGDLVLKDADGSIAWSTNTSGKSAAGLKLTAEGNLVLFGNNNNTVWQSFDHPTDCLVLGQKLMEGQKLTPSASTTNWTQSGLFSLFVIRDGLFASIGSDPPQVYFSLESSGRKMNKEPTYVRFMNGSFVLFENSLPVQHIYFPAASSIQLMRFGPDGHLRVYEWQSQLWKEVADVFTDTGNLDECYYPTVCGNYGICSTGDCNCPQPTYFNQIDERRPDLGCSEINPLSCEASQYHSFVKLMNTTYFTFHADLENVDLDTCMLACSKNCSCKAAIFKYYNRSSGHCYLPSQIFSLIDSSKAPYKSVVYLKVQNITNEQNVPPAIPVGKKKSQMPIVLRYGLASFFGLLLLIGVIVFLVWKKGDANEAKEDHLDQVPGMLMRFCYEDLKAMAANFTKLLGEGGFGSVFEGTLNDGTKIAVKRLNGLGQVKKSFLAEVEALVSIHHVNLVRLLGFCAEKSHRLLVYEYMSNGSLDKWIFHKTSHKFVLNWEQRKKIILDVAKGLTYLHEDCRQKIIHSDIKPQNILLDDNLSAKISDFGLSKLIDRDQSKTVTTMRGTPGYLAPEWLSSVITEKVDIYSFGVVVLEILCGRRNFDPSQPEDRRHLVKIFEKNEEEDQLLDLVDTHSDDMQVYRAQILNMMKVAVWCLQSDNAKRPSMSVVVKVLEGVMEVEDYTLSNPPLERTCAEFTELLPSVLSGPR